MYIYNIMSAREVYQNAIVPQFNSLPFQIPPTNPIVQAFKASFTSTITIPANTSFYNQIVTISGINANDKKIAISVGLEDGIDFTGALPFGLLSWVPDSANTIIASFWNSTNAGIDLRLEIVAF